MKHPHRNWLWVLAVFLAAVLVACPPTPTASPTPGTPDPGTPDPGMPAKIPQPPMITSFTATPDTLPAGGGETKLEWSVTGAAGEMQIRDIGKVTGNSKTLNVKATKTFELIFVNLEGSVSSTVDVTVSAPGNILKAGTWDSSNWNEATWQ